MRFLHRQELRPYFEGKTVAVVGSGPGSIQNAPGFIDSHDVVVRVNNYKTTAETGKRTDVFYSFFGSSIRKTTSELLADGVKLCMCKCPDGHALESEWHRKNKKLVGIDYRYIYKNREPWWFCDTYIPAAEEFIGTFQLLGRHIPTTGFSAILAVLANKPKSVFLTGFDFFRSGIHNVDEPWREKNTDDPIGHAPERELAWLIANLGRHPISVDTTLLGVMQKAAA